MKRLASPGEVLEELIRLLRDNARLRRWIRFWRRFPEVSITNLYGPPSHDYGREVPTVDLDASLNGDAPPKRRPR